MAFFVFFNRSPSRVAVFCVMFANNTMLFKRAYAQPIPRQHASSWVKYIHTRLRELIRRKTTHTRETFESTLLRTTVLRTVHRTASRELSCICSITDNLVVEKLKVKDPGRTPTHAWSIIVSMRKSSLSCVFREIILVSIRETISSQLFEVHPTSRIGFDVKCCSSLSYEYFQVLECNSVL